MTESRLRSGVQKAARRLVDDAGRGTGRGSGDADTAGADWMPGEPSERIVPPPPTEAPADTESLDVWGFADSGFAINERGHVEMRGDRYPLAGDDLSAFVPWARDVMGIDLDPEVEVATRYPARIPEPVRNDTFVKELGTFLDESLLDDDPEQRLRHGHGHTLMEMYAIKHDGMERVPDLVVHPESDEQVAQLVTAAVDHDVVLIPYGGGTSVTEALVCPENEQRMIVSVDMSRMNRILWIDPVNRMAEIQAGAVGRKITDQLAAYGFTMGHEPDSVEFSTLGGWIATNASGMKKNKYGNIEDLVLDVTAVTPKGELTHRGAPPRESIGMDARHWIFGSEGNLGIITSAVVKLFPTPEVQEFGSVLFPTFEHGVAFMYELAREGDSPASVRLVDNLQFQFSMALKPANRGLGKLKSAAEKLFVTKIKGYDPDAMVACTLVFEGSPAEVAVQQARVKKIAGRHEGMLAGGANGERGYALTFSIAYIRDFIMRYGVLGESFETSVSWSQVLALVENVKARVVEEHERRNLPNKPFISARVTQIYDTGVCVYFYLGLGSEGVSDPVREFAEIERACRQVILDSGGSLSHHHGVGKLRRHFIPEIMSDAAIAWNRNAKDAIDPSNVFGAANFYTDGETSTQL